ncbi:MAG: adenylyltransferase/cytidyltransferase family protein [Muribaculaceae bacterium]|nr:adenylyltransferase/cytidyltransferase family protein [Muribaculaceae bacterium]
MKRVITYGTYDLLHYGHIKLLERAKELGDYLIVGVTSDDFDRTRGKINVKQSLMERVESVRQTGLADEIIVEEYEGQKIDDIQRLGVDIFTVGSDWVGKFDYLGDYCKVVYLDRTQGVSSTELRSQSREIRMGVVGHSHIVAKYKAESEFVNGLTIVDDASPEDVDAVYIVSHPTRHYEDCRRAIEAGKHVLCESPLALDEAQVKELFSLADTKGVLLVEGLKTAYSTAYSRMILLARGGRIGDIVSVDSTCTSLKNLDYADDERLASEWNSLTSWGPTALLPVFDLLGTEWEDAQIFSRIVNSRLNFDDFSKISLLYNGAVSSSKVGKGVKSEGELVISGTEGYIYVPAPWWKTDYFELRFENPEKNRRYFYQLDGEGIRNELVSFVRMMEGTAVNPISRATSLAFARVMGAAGIRTVNLQKEQ